MQYRLAMLVVVAALGCGAGQQVRSETSQDVVTVEATASVEAADEELELRAEVTTPAELRARVEHPLVRPPLAQIEQPAFISWVFAAHPGAITEEESRPALKDGTGEPRAAMSTVTSDPVGRELITTIAEADVDGARLRYVP
jgi:hypothetical protein